MFYVMGTAFDSWHTFGSGGGLVMRSERLHGAHILLGDVEVAALITGHGTAFTAVEVALTAFALQELAALGFDDALSDGFGRFLLHILEWM